jgi:predicted enzyme related to lactoylglutathione lyase
MLHESFHSRRQGAQDVTLNERRRPRRKEIAMPTHTKAPKGTFCWIELQSSDLAASRKFYESLFGWRTSDVPGPQPYVMAANGANNVAGLTVLPEAAKKMGAPPNWLSYVAVDDAAESAKKVASLGGKVLMGPMEMGPGKMVVAQDPTGAVLALWQQLQPMGTFQFGDPGSLGWNELSTTNVDRAGTFYRGLLGWTPKANEMPGMVYTTFMVGDSDVMAGGMMAQPKEMAGAPSMWTVYFSVDDADKTAESAKGLGAQVLVPPTDIPTIGRFAVLSDPQGAAFSVIKFLPRAT